MPDSWATSLDLHLDVPTGGRGISAALIRALREAARGGRLPPDTRLPSSRALATDLGIARNTVAEAYAQLVAEGWLTARQGSGTRVAGRAQVRSGAARPRKTPSLRHPLNPPVTFNLLPGQPDASAFPRTAWAVAVRRALVTAPAAAFGYQGPAGRPELREALAGYLTRARGVDATPDRIVVCSGFRHGLALVCEVLRARGLRRIAVEAYGIPEHWAVIRRAGLTPVPMPVDAGCADVGELAGGGAQAVLLTPAHQFALGGALRPQRRAAVVDWARRTGGWVLEDDYDGEFRYDRQPVGALQGLDPDRIVYLGTASKSLAPALRLGWIVLPSRLVGELQAVKGAEWMSSAVDQLALAEMITSGAYDRHVRGMRGRYRRRRDRLTAMLAVRASWVAVTGIAAGLHAVVLVPPGTEDALVARAGGEGLALAGLRPLVFPGAGPAPDALLVGYATPPDHLFPGALAALARVLGGLDG